MKKATIIIPTYNEKDNIGITLTAVFKVFETIKNWEMEVLVVDDTSPDGTYKLVQKLQKNQKKLKLLINKEKSGLGGAYLKGMDYAFNTLKSDVVFEFDADLSHNPKKIPQFLKKINEGYDLVIGSRYIPGGSIPKDWGLHRKFLSIFGNIIIMTILTNFTIRDWTSGFRAITKEVYNKVSTELDNRRFAGYTFQIGFLHKTIRNGFKVTEVPFHFKDREIGSSKIGPEYIKNTMLYILKVRLQEIMAMRLFKFVVVGSIGALTQLISLQIWRTFFTYQLAFFLAIELAVLANFILSNLWTFSDRKLKITQLPLKFIQFNLASGGSILIQQIIAFLGEKFIGFQTIFTLPVINFVFETGTLFAIVGIFVGMFWNFFAYSKIVWKSKKSN